MTHRDEIKERLLWSQNKEWYGFDANKGYYLKKTAPLEAKNSFKKWVAHQDELGDAGCDYSLDIV